MILAFWRSNFKAADAVFGTRLDYQEETRMHHNFYFKFEFNFLSCGLLHRPIGTQLDYWEEMRMHGNFQTALRWDAAIQNCVNLASNWEMILSCESFCIDFPDSILKFT